MSTTTDTTTRPSEEEPVDPAPVPLPDGPYIDKDGNEHDHPVHTDCGPGCVTGVPA